MGLVLECTMRALKAFPFHFFSSVRWVINCISSISYSAYRKYLLVPVILCQTIKKLEGNYPLSYTP